MTERESLAGLVAHHILENLSWYSKTYSNLTTRVEAVLDVEKHLGKEFDAKGYHFKRFVSLVRRKIGERYIAQEHIDLAIKPRH